MIKECRKVSFVSEKFANEHIEKLKRTSERKQIPCRAYLCEKCNTWHLTKIELKTSEIQRKIHKLELIIEKQKLKLNDQEELVNNYKIKIKNQSIQIVSILESRKNKCLNCLYTKKND